MSFVITSRTLAWRETNRNPAFCQVVRVHKVHETKAQDIVEALTRVGQPLLVGERDTLLFGGRKNNLGNQIG